MILLLILWLIFYFVVVFLFFLWECVSEEEADDEGVGCANGEEREKNERK